MFVRKLVEIKEAAEEVELRSKIHEQKATHSNKAICRTQTKTVKWVGQPTHKEDDRTYYRKAVVDGEVIQPGDCVYLRTDKPEPWFAKVIALFHDDSEGGFMFHARFFSHGRETVLGEFAGERELFLLDDCADNHLESVMGKCNIAHLEPDEREPTEFIDKNWWFYRLWYDTEHASFEDADLHEGHVGECYSCIAQEKEKTRNTVEWIAGGFRLKGHEYHINDFVYLLTGAANEPYVIGQIRTLDKAANTATVRIFMRSDATSSLDHYKMIEEGHKQKYKDSRKLHYTDDYETVKLTDMEGTCWIERECVISDMAAYKTDPNHFYLGSTKLIQCEQCKLAREEKQKNETEFLQSFSKLRALDIFGGCGGLTCGMDMTGVVQTRYAIEFNPDAAVSFERNFAETIVYNQCANTLLSRAIAQHGRNEQVEPLDDFRGRPIKEMPRPGDIDFIYCGPPCQGFSGINKYKKLDEIKNTLVCTALSYVDFYKPSYFLLENVRGLVSFKLGKEQIESGVLKYIIRCLTSMGYQARFSIQQAGNHGVAQSRRRLFVWGAKIGKELPDFPEVSHCFPGGCTTIHFKNGTSVSYDSRTGGRAPLPRITVGDAISELPGFEMKNVHKVFPDNEKYKEIREKTLVKQLDCLKMVAGEDVQDYTNPPVTDFQAWLRNGAEKLYNHVMRGFDAINIERIYNIEMRPGADHLCLPPELEPWCLNPKNPTSARNKFWRGLYGRLDFNDKFKTALTDMSPMGKQGTIVHPNQRRILTVREAARSQGFPDTFIFDSAAEARNRRIVSMHMQIGNAVPIPLSLALGRRLKEAMIKDWLKSRGRSSQQQ
ncbi:S-adenosyl-L-methionine-dependent methyltransferase [Dichotomocladium elegans]|nr:S-adenosyl-L-methionine-dependent methyltransferase [Dichotomocladium elegans]